MAPAAASLLPAAATGSKRPAASDVAEQLAQGDQETARKNQQQQQQQLECPRCGSGNTKFCYYNNYSTTQPRHFCRACRRYWTHGGTLRKVPVGGACRRGGNKRRRLDGSADQPSSSASPPPTSARSEDAYPDLPTFPFLSDGVFLPQFDLGGVAPAGLSWPSAAAVPDFYDGLAAPWGSATLADGVTGAWNDFTGLELSWPPPAGN